jgi:hypothetical protein
VIVKEGIPSRLKKGEGEIPLPLTPSHQGRENCKKFCNLL